MTDLQRFGWAFSVIVAVAVTILLVGTVAASATPSPSPSPSPAPAATCDPYAGLVDTEDGIGCAIRVTAEESWLEAWMVGGVLVIGSLFALVALNVRR